METVTKRCTKCKQTQPKTLFAPDRRNNRDGLQSHCKPCKAVDERERRLKNPEHIRALEKAWRVRNPAAKRISDRKSKHGITDMQWQQMLAAQDHRCAICLVLFVDVAKGANIDHDHVTGHRRGLLCGPCNRGLEPIERPGFVERARTYLTSHGSLT